MFECYCQNMFFFAHVTFKFFQDNSSLINLASKLLIVLVITFYLPSCLDEYTAKGPFGLRVKLLSAYLFTTHSEGFTLSLLIGECQAGKLCATIFIIFGLNRPGIELESTISVANTVFTRPLICN